MNFTSRSLDLIILFFDVHDLASNYMWCLQFPFLSRAVVAHMQLCTVTLEYRSETVLTWGHFSNPVAQLARAVNGGFWMVRSLVLHALCGAVELFIIFPSGTPCGQHSLEELPFCVSHQGSPTLQATFAFDGVVTAAAEAFVPAGWQLHVSWHSWIKTLCQACDFLSTSGHVQGEQAFVEMVWHQATSSQKLTIAVLCVEKLLAPVQQNQENLIRKNALWAILCKILYLFYKTVYCWIDTNTPFICPLLSFCNLSPYIWWLQFWIIFQTPDLQFNCFLIGI